MRKKNTDPGTGQAGRRTLPPTLEERLALIDSMAARREDLRRLSKELARESDERGRVNVEVRKYQEKLKKEFEVLCAPEYYPAVVVGDYSSADRCVEVDCAGTRLAVAVHPDVVVEQLRVGVRVLLSKGRNCVLKVISTPTSWTDVGAFEGYLPGDRRLLLRHQEHLVAASATAELASVELKKGDLVGFERDGARLAYARVEPPGREDLFFEEKPADRFEELGGLDVEIARIKRLLRFTFLHRDVAREYFLPTKSGILLQGPPGNGKTKIARCLPGYIDELVPGGNTWFMSIVGSSDYSMWLGRTEERLRERFQAVDEAAKRGPGVVFFDELDAIARRRGMDGTSAAPDRILNTLLGLLDGMQRISNVVFVGASNRATLLDQGIARPGRMGDLKIRIGAPNRKGARAILQRYLKRGMPLNAPAAEGDPVDALVEPLLSRLFSPRGEYAELASVHLRDGRQLPVRGRELLSGAVLENVVRRACEEAADRELEGGARGVIEDDLAVAVDRELEGAVSLLTPFNVHEYLAGLPPTAAVLDVVPARNGSGLSRYARSA